MTLGYAKISQKNKLKNRTSKLKSVIHKNTLNRVESKPQTKEIFANHIPKNLYLYYIKYLENSIKENRQSNF